MMSMAMASSIAMPVAAETPEGEQTVVDIENISVDESEDVLEDSDEESGVVEDFANNVETVDEKEAVEPQIENQANTGDEVQVLDSTDSAAEDSKCGENATWTLQDGVLHISGTGDMDDYDYDNTKAPWYGVKDQITSIIIDNGITSIGDFTFTELINLASVDIPDSVVRIGSCSFEWCTSIKKISVPKTVKEIGEGAFCVCKSLENIDLPESLHEQTFDDTFSNCPKLKQITIPKGVTELNTAFNNCESLTEIIVPEGVTGIGWYTFGECTNLQKIVLPKGILKIDIRAFDSCSSLEKIEIPDSVTDIEIRAFDGCTNLKKLILPKTLKIVGAGAFNNCTNLEDVYYAGTESDRVNLNIAQGNDLLINATWHYETTSDKPEDKPNDKPSDKPEVKDSEEAFVDRLYQNILGRDSDPAGAKAWTEELQSGEKTGVEVAQGFFESDEMKKREFTDEEYINALYLTFLNREADASGMAAWKAVLDSGLSRMHVFKGFAESQEFTVICDDYGIERGNANLTAPRDQNEGVTKFIARNYKMCLGRSADEDGINAWCNQILTGQNTAKEVAYGFVFSQEFKEKNLSDADFVKLLYNVFMNREADEAGFNAWMKVLKDGQSREHVFNGFADSVEFRDVCTDYGIQ